MTGASAGSPPIATVYGYDGNGRRVSKTVGASRTDFVYDAFGRLAAEYGTGTESGTRYITADHLGSTRLTTDGAGAVVKCYDYVPFGEALTDGRPGCYAANTAVQWPATDGNAVRFTGKERDAETGLDFFGARYFSGAQGRFTSPDLPLYDQSPFDPQSWNLYSYGRNNPLVNIDPSGRSCVKTQTVNPDGSKSDSSADDGDGKGCEAAGIKPDDQGGMGASGQQVNVSGKQGSLWDYLTTTVPRYVPNDTELPSGARNVFSKVYQNTWVIAQPVCSGGGFVFVGGGGNIPGTKIHAEGYFLPVDYESGKGFSSGVLGEVGIGHTPFAVGGEASVNWKTGQKSYAGLGFANKDVGGVKAGVASLGLLGDTHGNVGGYASVAGVGVGVYARPSFINGCPAH